MNFSSSRGCSIRFLCSTLPSAITLLFWLSLFLSVAFGQAIADVDQPVAPVRELRYGSLQVSSDQGGSLSIDGQNMGDLRPYEVMRFPKIVAGPHTLIVRKGSSSSTQQAEVQPDQPANVQFHLAADLPPPAPSPGRNAPPAEANPDRGALAPRIMVNPADGLKYVYIPPGKFRMGCSQGDNECDGVEKPAHDVEITRGFSMSQTKMTVGAYKRFVQAGNGSMPPAPPFNENWTSDGQPIVSVTWDEASAVCQWAGGRLPTEAEWEYAARAGTATPRCGSLDDIAWYDGNSGGKAHEVAQKQPNAFGLYDMLGNVLEWVADWFGEKYYAQSPSRDPRGASWGLLRVLRGGSWNVLPGYARASNRSGNEPSGRLDLDGFRCVREVP